jgi:hypothetical protein
MTKLVLWGIAMAAALFLLDRLFLWMESRGWLYYRRTKSRGGASLYHFMQIHKIYNPEIQEVIEIKYGEEQQEDESGEPPILDPLEEDRLKDET